MDLLITLIFTLQLAIKFLSFLDIIVNGGEQDGMELICHYGKKGITLSKLHSIFQTWLMQ